ncbi:dipeptide/oligopeptide/nickel ABC transporter permease/ATP-binding protein [Specibacter cremeus]|uniref:dipeptide/oligopeptide/nickel ABC transporter permease/ATP-binding protein n=1 Tax=Specibacter cremeus TaxID=1629051 RepID=UPI000F7AD888|nr:dipeptide/oligopeptide/nickel ABC transporter permease/ATP-binding protein [Specibacter cremeus]
MTAPLTDNIDPRAARRGSVLGRFLRRPAGAISLGVFAVVVLVAVFAPLLAPHDPNFVDLSLFKAPPSAAHPLGGDSTGRDILSRLLFGARTTLIGAAIAIAVAVGIGVPSGLAAGYFGGVFDKIATWVSDALQAVPGMIILLIVAAASRNSFTFIMITVGVFLMPGYFRLTRSTTLTVRNEAYIDAAIVSGLSNTRILAKHVIKAVYAPIIIQTALTAGMAMGMQAGLQFLGIGSANTPGWGAMMNDGFTAILTDPLLLLWPSLALGITIAALAVMGSTLSDVLSVRQPAPRRKRRPAAPSSVDDATTGALHYEPAAAAVQVRNLKVSYPGADADIEVVHGIDLDVAPGEVLGIVGESGSGKSQTVFSILDLLPAAGVASCDALWIGGRDVSALDRKDRHKLLGSKLGYVPQEPMTNLDPSYTIGYQLIEPLRSVHKLGRTEARERAIGVLTRVGIHDPARVMRSYPHQLSGGMAQRVLIAGAISGHPSVLIADEPTTALDVTVQAEVLELLRELQQEYGMALVIVTHNFGVVADICDRVAVMKHGEIVEVGDVATIFTNPANDYTRELIAASLDDAASRTELDAAYDTTERKAVNA